MGVVEDQEYIDEWNKSFTEWQNKAIARRREKKLIQESDRVMTPRVPRHTKTGGGAPSYKTTQRFVIRNLANNIIGTVWDPQRQRFTGQVKEFAKSWMKKAKKTKESMATDLSWLGDTASESRKDLEPLFKAEWISRMGKTPDMYDIVKKLESGDSETLKKQQEVMIGPKYVEAQEQEEEVLSLSESGEGEGDPGTRDDTGEEADGSPKRAVWDTRLGKKAKKSKEAPEEE